MSLFKIRKITREGWVVYRLTNRSQRNMAFVKPYYCAGLARYTTWQEAFNSIGL